jgi:hypothetical protein
MAHFYSRERKNEIEKWQDTLPRERNMSVRHDTLPPSFDY